MPAPPLENTFDGGTNGTVISVANSGGPSGNGFQNVVLGPDPTYSNAQAHSGSLSMMLAQTGTASEAYVEWTGAGALTGDVWFRFYVWIDAVPVTTSARIFEVETDTGANCAALRFSTAGVLVGLNAAGSPISGTTGTTAVLLDQWVRIEVRVRPSTTEGEFEWWLFQGVDLESSTPTETKASGSAEALAANVDHIEFGHIGTGGLANQTWYYDDLAVSTAGRIGPTGGAVADPALNTNVTKQLNQQFRVRTEIQETAGAAVNQALQLRFSKNGGPYQQVTASTDLRPAASTKFADGDPTTNLLPSGTGSFVAGVGEEGDAVTPVIAFPSAGHTEIEQSLVIVAGSVGDTFDLRWYRSDGTPLDAYPQTPRITLTA